MNIPNYCKFCQTETSMNGLKILQYSSENWAAWENEPSYLMAYNKLLVVKQGVEIVPCSFHSCQLIHVLLSPTGESFVFLFSFDNNLHHLQDKKSQ